MRHYITNMDNPYRPIVEEAISASGRYDIHIDDNPMPIGSGDAFYYRDYLEANRDSFSVYVDRNMDCSDFWECFDRLKQTKRWKTWLVVSGVKVYGAD